MSSRDAQIQKRLSQMPEIYRKNYLQAVNRRSRLAAIKAFCLECCDWEKEEVKKCTDVGCPLWSFRPFSRLKERQKVPENQRLLTIESI